MRFVQWTLNNNDRIVCLKDENLNYLFVNKEFKVIFKNTICDIKGLSDYDLFEKDFADQLRKADAEAQLLNKPVDREIINDNRILKCTIFPVIMLNGKIGVGADIKDITKEREFQKIQDKMLSRYMVLGNILTHSFNSTQEQFDYVLHQALELTESQHGYIYLYDDLQSEFILKSWSKGVVASCKPNEKQCRLEDSEIWGEAIRQCKPVIINDFKQYLVKNELQQSHIKIDKFLSVPIIIEGNIVAVIGLANKHSDYNNNDIYSITLLINGVWNDIKRKETQDKLVLERNKYRQILVSIGDGVMVVDNSGRIEMLNNVAEKLTGWSLEQVAGVNYRDIFNISSENEDHPMTDPIEMAFVTDRVFVIENNVVLTSRDGNKYFLEESAAPIKDSSDNTMGVVLVFRDVTSKIIQRKEIEYLSFHDSMTGLYNRRFLEEELHRIDTKSNLPISVIIGDINCLKLTNDIFGHSHGDILIKKVSQVMSKVCKKEDVIVRCGGDEFLILLPKTGITEVKKIMERIRNETEKEQIKAIKGSISMGADTKESESINIWDTIDRAEEDMYIAKTLGRDEVKRDTINSIINNLHQNNPREKEHSIHVKRLCQNMAEILNLSDIDTKKLKDAGYLHDIGKIVLESRLLENNYSITDKEWNEIKKHPIIGYRILNSFDHTIDIAELVLNHQERWDGSGYPKGLKGEEIPLLARIIALAESYDRKLSANCGKRKEEVIQSVKNNAGKHFDPKLTEIFTKMVETENGGVDA